MDRLSRLTQRPQLRGRREHLTTGISPQVQPYAGGLITHFLCERSCNSLSIKGHEAHRVVTSAPTGSTEGRDRAWLTNSRVARQARD